MTMNDDGGDIPMAILYNKYGNIFIEVVPYQDQRRNGWQDFEVEIPVILRD